MTKMFMGLLFFLILFQVTESHSEYRVFRLKISKKTTAPTTDERIVESTLDPEQYRLYYPVAADEVISYTETWRCYGNTSETPFCPQPERQPSSAATNNQNPRVNSPSPP